MNVLIVPVAAAAGASKLAPMIGRAGRFMSFDKAVRPSPAPRNNVKGSCAGP